MLSTSQQYYVDNIVHEMYSQGYVYYLVHTNTNISQTSNNQWRDLTLYFSKSPIIAENPLQYVMTGENIKEMVITGNASRDRQEPRVERITQSSRTILIQDYEWIITNADNAQSMNVISKEEYNYFKNVDYHITSNQFMAIPVILGITFLFTWLHKVFPRLEKDKQL